MEFSGGESSDGVKPEEKFEFPSQPITRPHGGLGWGVEVLLAWQTVMLIVPPSFFFPQPLKVCLFPPSLKLSFLIIQYCFSPHYALPSPILFYKEMQ